MDTKPTHITTDLLERLATGKYSGSHLPMWMASAMAMELLELREATSDGDDMAEAMENSRTRGLERFLDGKEE